jgi:hypothetical protein
VEIAELIKKVSRGGQEAFCGFVSMRIGGCLEWGYPNSWMVYFMENLIKMDDDWGYSYFGKAPIRD